MFVNNSFDTFDSIVLMRIEEDLVTANIMKQAEMSYQAGLIDQQAYRVFVRKISDDLENRIKKRSEVK